MFAMLQNPFWSAGGDSEVYLDMARNLARGQGYLFNHQPVSEVTPLWPIVLAGAMRISASFAFLKLVPMLCMTAGLLIWYRILLRLVSPKVAAWAVVVSAMLAPLETLTYRFYTEGFFTLVASAAVLAALQINEGRRMSWRVPLLLILCAAVIGTRWAGILWYPLIAGALFHGRAIWPVSVWRRYGKLTIICLATLVITLVTFFGLRHALRVRPDQIDPRYDAQLANHYDFINEEPTFSDYADRISAGWQWIGDLVWQPASIAGKLTKRGVCVVASVTLLAVIIYLPSLVKRKAWLFVALLVYFGVLCFDWPRPVARYLVPAAPLMLVLLYQACGYVADLVPRYARHLRPWVTVGVWSVVICNLIFAAVEMYVARARDYYKVFEAGLNRAFIDDIVYSVSHGAGDAEIAINPVNVSLKNSGQFRNRYMRAAVVISDRGIRMIPEELAGVRGEDSAVTMLDPIGEPITKWLQQEHVRFYMYRPPASTMWHFDVRGTPWGPPEGPPDAMDWKLFEVTPEGLHQITPPRVKDWPKRMPGME
jgi:hypothetical protein